MGKKMLITFLSIILVGIIFVLVGIISSNKIVMNSYEYESGFNMKVAHITDTHFTDKYKEDKDKKIYEYINESNPDVVFFTGDLFEVDNISPELEEDIISLLSQIECAEKFAVLGNHDIGSGSGSTKTEIVIRVLEASGFTVLQNSNIEITVNDELYNLIGLDDYMMGDNDYTTILDTTNSYDNNIILSHEPDTFDYVYDLNVLAMFSGHSHGGQVRLPFIGGLVNVPGAKKYTKQYYKINDSELFVSYGLGATIIPIRFYNTRQLELYEFS